MGAPAPAQTQPMATPGTVKCQRCGSDNADALKFCNNCGASLVQGYAQPVVQPAAQPAPQPVPQPQMTQPVPPPYQMPMQPTYYQPPPRPSLADTWIPLLMSSDFVILLVGVIILYQGLFEGSYWSGMDWKWKLDVVLELLIGAWVSFIGLIRVMKKVPGLGNLAMR